MTYKAIDGPRFRFMLLSTIRILVELMAVTIAMVLDGTSGVGNCDFNVTFCQFVDTDLLAPNNFVGLIRPAGPTFPDGPGNLLSHLGFWQD